MERSHLGPSRSTRNPDDAFALNPLESEPREQGDLTERPSSDEPRAGDRRPETVWAGPRGAGLPAHAAAAEARSDRKARPTEPVARVEKGGSGNGKGRGI